MDCSEVLGERNDSIHVVIGKRKLKYWVGLGCSERLARSQAEGQRAKEACSINKSLSSLGDVFAALASKSAHIPYRNSKLTHLLQVTCPLTIKCCPHVWELWMTCHVGTRW